MSKIEWTEETWNPLHGCSRAAYTSDGVKHAHPGCDNCYAISFAGRKLKPEWAELTRRTKDGLDWSGVIQWHPDRLPWLFERWKPRRDGTGRRIFVCSGADLGHPAVTDHQRAAIYGAMVLSPWNTYQNLTKRPAEIASFKREWSPQDCIYEVYDYLQDVPGVRSEELDLEDFAQSWGMLKSWDDVRGNVHEYVSISDQPTADALVPALLEMPAAVRGVSLEPMIGPVDLSRWLSHLQHVIVGGESGRGARPCDLAWIVAVVDQCRAAGVPCFVKQLGAKPVCDARLWPNLGSKGQNFHEWPAELQVREIVR